MTESSRAWVVDVGAAGHVAAGERHVAEYLVATDTVPLPRTQSHCVGVIYWRGRHIPVIDLAPLYGVQTSAAGRRAVVLAYQTGPGEALQYGALLIHSAPVEAWVTNDMAAEVPSAPPALRHISRASFYMKDQIIPILDVRRLFAQTLPASVFPREPRPIPSSVETAEIENGADIADESPETGQEKAVPALDWGRVLGLLDPSPMEMPEPPPVDSQSTGLRPADNVVTPFIPRRPWSAADTVAQVLIEDSLVETGDGEIPAGTEDVAAYEDIAATFAEPPMAPPVPPAARQAEPIAAASLQEIYASVSGTRRKPGPSRRRLPRTLLAVLVLAVAGMLAWGAMSYFLFQPSVRQTPTRTKVPAVHSKKTAAVGSASIPDAPVQPPR